MGGAVPELPFPVAATARDYMCKVLQATFRLSGWCHQSCFPMRTLRLKGLLQIAYLAKELGFEPHFSSRQEEDSNKTVSNSDYSLNG